MAEGGVFPWKLQRSDVRYANYEDIFHPLPPPPGKVWVNNKKTREWALVDSSVYHGVDEIQEVNQNHIDALFVEHVVMPDDTLQGICLRYDTTVRTLRQHNNFAGENFRVCPTLLIPLKKNKTKIRFQDLNDESIKMQLFQNKTGLQREESRYYLSSTDWDIDRAIEEYRLDAEFERNNQHKLPQISSYHHKEKADDTQKEIIAIGEPIEIIDAIAIDTPLLPTSR